MKVLIDKIALSSSAVEIFSDSATGLSLQRNNIEMSHFNEAASRAQSLYTLVDMPRCGDEKNSVFFGLLNRLIIHITVFFF